MRFERIHSGDLWASHWRFSLPSTSCEQVGWRRRFGTSVWRTGGLHDRRGHAALAIRMPGRDDRLWIR